MASKEMSFENVDDGRRMPAYTISSPLAQVGKKAFYVNTLVQNCV